MDGINIVTAAWISDLNWHRVLRFYFSVNLLLLVKILVSIEIEKIYQTVENYSLHSQTPQNSSKILRCASYIQFFSECLELNAMKRCLPCLICFVKARS